MQEEAKKHILISFAKNYKKYGRFPAKTFLVRATAMERNACSYTVWRDVSLKFISANNGLPRVRLIMTSGGSPLNP